MAEPDEVSTEMTDAQRAAARLPDPPKRGDERESLVVFCVVAIPVLLGIPIWVLLVAVGREPWGWVLDVAGLVSYLVLRGLLFLLPGTQTGIVTVDDEGVVHVRTGRFAVRRIERLFSVGAKRWIVLSVVSGLVTSVVTIFLPLVLAFAIDPKAMLVWLAAVAFCCIDLLRWFVVAMFYRRSKRQRILHAHVMLPVLALHAHAHGHEEVGTGVPAHWLLETLETHPERATLAAQYAKYADDMEKLMHRSLY